MLFASRPLFNRADDTLGHFPQRVMVPGNFIFWRTPKVWHPILNYGCIRPRDRLQNRQIVRRAQLIVNAQRLPPQGRGGLFPDDPA
jgi:hypothetical protein